MDSVTILIVLALCSLGAVARYLDGAGAEEQPLFSQIPGLVYTGIIAVAGGVAAYLTSESASAAIISTVVAGVCVVLGQTHWESWKWQMIRGGFFGLLLVVLLTYTVQPLSVLSVLGTVMLYVLAYVPYFWTHNGNGHTIHPPIGHWEQYCRIIQGGCLVGASAAAYLV